MESGTFCRWILHVLLLNVLLTKQCSAECMSQFRLNPSAFKICEQEECLLFRTEIPFVFLDSKMDDKNPKPEHQLPFRCKTLGDLYPNLKGPFFDIVNHPRMRVLDNARCVWAASCEFDDIVKFVSVTANKTNPKPKFIAGGLLFMLQYRMSINSIPSAPLLEDQLIIVGPRKDDNATWANAWAAMWRPFTTRSWIMLLLTILFVLFLRLWVSYFFTRKEPSFDWRQFRNYLVGDYDDVNKFRNDSERRKLKRHSDPREVRRLNNYLSNGMGIFFVITILYYEIAVVDFVFEDRRDSMKRVDPNNFIILNKSTQDYVFGQQFGDRRGCVKPCWKKASNTNEIYETIYNDSKHNNIRYTVAYETFNRYHFKENTNLCNRLAVLEYEEVNRRFAGVWYYSSHIPPQRRMVIDKQIVRLREEDVIRKTVHAQTGSELPAQCQTSGGISVLLLTLPLAILPGPIFALVFFYLVLYTVRRRDEEREEDDEESTENPDYSEDTSMSGETTTYANHSGLDLKIPRAMYIPRA